MKNLDINGLDDFGRTPLHYAYPLSVVSGEPSDKTVDKLKFFTSNGANPDIKDFNGQTPYQSYINSRTSFISDLKKAKIEEKRRIAEIEYLEELERIKAEHEKKLQKELKAQERRERIARKQRENEEFNAGLKMFVSEFAKNLNEDSAKYTSSKQRVAERWENINNRMKQDYAKKIRQAELVYKQKQQKTTSTSSTTTIKKEPARFSNGIGPQVECDIKIRQLIEKCYSQCNLIQDRYEVAGCKNSCPGKFNGMCDRPKRDPNYTPSAIAE